jgi:hypothetical protein
MIVLIKSSKPWRNHEYKNKTWYSSINTCFRCKIVKSNSPADKPRAKSLQAINPRIGFDDYECDKGFLGLWFVYDWGNC